MKGTVAVRECCEIRAEVPPRQRRTLEIVLAVNAAMFVTELASGIHGHSTSLVADSVDMLGDAIVYGGVPLASVGVGLLHSARPDIAVGLLIAGVFGVSAIGVIGKARRQLA